MINYKISLIIKRIIRLTWNQDTDTIIKQTMTIIFNLLKNNGTLYTIKYLKTCRLVITRYMCGKRLYKVPMFVKIKNGFPEKFLYLKPLIDSQENIKIKIILTIMNLSKCIKPLKGEIIPIDYTTITNPYKGKRYTIPGPFVKKWIRSITNLKVNPPVTKMNYYLSLKMGPHGPTIWSIMDSMKYYQHTNILNLLVLGGKDFVNKLFGPIFSYVNHNELTIPQGPSKKKVKTYSHKELGRLAIVKDPECKMRVIAMIDYFSQITLKPIHDTLLDILSKKSCDRTFTQNPIHTWEGKDNFYSFDLTAATDRFPIILQAKLLSYLYDDGWKLAKHWISILHDRNYITPEGDKLQYSVGQPMGCYSSWAMFTLTHHLVVAWCAHLCGHTNFTNYILLGDDIVIKDNKVAKQYKRVMRLLGVDISEAKTHVSKDTYEFAKRWIRRGKEVSGLPLRGIADNLKNPLIFYMILLDYFTLKANTFLGRDTLCVIVEKVLHRLEFRIKGKTFRFNPRFLKTNLWYLSTVVRKSLGLATNEELRNFLAIHSSNLGEIVLPHDITILWKRVISNGLADLVKSNTLKILKAGDHIWKYMTILFPDLNLVSTIPFLIALSNYLERTLLNIEKYKLSLHSPDDQIDLISIVKEINFLDFNKVATWDRNWYPAACLTTKLVKQSLRYMRTADSIEEFYMDSLTISGQREKIDNIRFNAINTLKRITPILEKKYNNLPPQATAMIKQMSLRHGGAFWL